MEQNSLNFDSLKDFAYDISDIPGMEPSKLSELDSLGVQTSESYDAMYPAYDVKKAVSKEDAALREAEEEKPTKTIEVNIDEPNLILPRSELIRALRYAGVMIKKVTNDIESSSLNITYTDEGKVVYRLKDNMTWVTLEGSCEVSNNKPITKTLSFNTSYLQRLITTAGADKVLLYEGKSKSPTGEEIDVIYVRLTMGDYIVNTFYGNEEKLTPAGNRTYNIGSVPATDILALCNSMLPLINDTQEVQSKRTIIYEDRAIFHSITFSLQFKYNFNFRMCLGKKELELLHIVASSLNGNNIEFYETDSNGENRIVIIAPNITISTSVSIPSRDELIVMNLEKIASAKYMKLDKEELKKVLSLSCLGTSTVGRVRVNYNIENLGLDVDIIGVSGDSSLLVSGENYSNTEPLDVAQTIYAPNLALLLRSFETGKDFQISLLDSGFAVKDSTLNISASMSYSSK